MTTLIDLGKLRFNFDGVWNSSMQYELNDCVTYGGNVYAYTNTTATTGNLPTNTAYWTLMVQGFNWRGNWATATAYKIHDVVFSGISSYLVLNTYTSGASVAVDVAAGNLTFLAVGAADILPSYTSANAGQSLVVNPTGTGIQWKGATASTYDLYVSPNGSDSNDGKNINSAKASVQAAVAAIPSGASVTIHVMAGTYSEALLPIVVPPFCAIVGDSTRTTIIQPASGFAADGTTPNNQATMWALSNGSLLNKMTFQGMTGWVPGSTAADITTSTPKGIFCGLNPASPITTKSPYVIECSCFSNGGIGAYINGSVHTTGNKSILFHEFTGIHDNGVGIWVDNNGKSECVGVFTYYCYFGYATTHGGQIRSISGNNSYGTYGAVSSGYNAGETPITGNLFGTLITLTAAYTGTINVGDTVTDTTSGATGTVTNVQVQGLYVTSVTGTFGAGHTITTTSGGTGTISSYGGQQGYVLVMNNLSALPQVGQSVQIAGDTSAYIISNVSGTYSGTGSVISVVVAQQIPNPETTNAAVTIRSQFSLNRITAHDFLNIGTGGISTTNYPGTPTQAPNAANQVIQSLPGRVYYIAADQQGNFQVGQYFAVNQATGAATLNANSFNLSGLTSLRLGSIGAQLGAQINEFSTDGTMSQNSPVKVPTQSAVVTYVQANTNTITGPNSVQCQTGTAYSFQYGTFSNQGIGTVTWSLTGTVPSGITINSSGVLSVANSVSTGSYSFTVQAVFSGTGTTLTKVISTVVNPGVPIFNTNTLPSTTLVQPSSSFSNNSTQVTVGSGTPSYAVTSGALPSWVTLGASTGLLTGTAPGTTAPNATYNFTVTATNGVYTVVKSFTWTFQINYPVGQSLFYSAGTYTWVAPAGVTSVSVVAVGGGGSGPRSYNSSAGGGCGGGLGWKNNITVIPGNSYTVVVGSGATGTSYGSGALLGGNSYFINTSTVAGYGGGHYSYGGTGGPNANSYGGGWYGDGGGAGGYGSSYASGSGAGGYAGNGGNASNQYGSGGGGASGYNYSSTYGYPSGGGVGLLGQGPSGVPGLEPWTPTGGGPGGAGGAGSYNGPSGGTWYWGYGGSAAAGQGTGGMYGENPYSSTGQTSSNLQGGFFGAGGGGQGDSWPQTGGYGGTGGVRIIWGPGRSFPSTLTVDQTPVP